jgi:hypothetical protein
MEYTIYSIKNLAEENENEVIELSGNSAGDFTAIVQVPYNLARQTRFQGTLLVTVAKPGLLGWLQRKIIGW